MWTEYWQLSTAETICAKSEFWFVFHHKNLMEPLMLIKLSLLQLCLEIRIFSLALYFPVPLNFQKNLNFSFSVDSSTYPELWSSFITCNEFMTLKSLYLHKLFSRHTAINLFCKTECHNTCKSELRISQMLWASVRAIHCLKSWRACQPLPFLTHFLIFCNRSRRESRMEQVEGKNLQKQSIFFFFTLSKMMK